MKLHLLGTSAGKPVPRPFCSCRVCRHAIRAGGPDVRTRTGVTFAPGATRNDAVAHAVDRPRYQVDLSPDWTHQLIRDRIDPSGLEHLLFTHPDGDHCCPEYLRFRSTLRSEVGDLPVLDLYGSQAVRERVTDAVGDLEANRCRFTVVEDGDTFRAGDVTVTAFRSTHSTEGDCLHYAVDDGERRVLFGWDGTWTEEIWERLREWRFDAVLLECTWTSATGREMGSHLDYDLLVDVVDRLRDEGIVGERAPIVTMHMGDNGDSTHAEAQERFARHGVTAGYDGLRIDVPRSEGSAPSVDT